MKKIIAIVILALSLSTIAFILINDQNDSDKSSAQDNLQPSPSPAPQTPSLKEYVDPSGFKFSHIDDVIVKKKSVKDDNVYSLLELTSSNSSGKTTLEVTGSSLTSLDKWISKYKTASHEAQKLKIADMNAIELVSKTGIVTGALDKGVLFMISTDLSTNPDFWKRVYKQITTSFRFAPPETTSGSSGTNASPPSNDDISFEGEEVIE